MLASAANITYIYIYIFMYYIYIFIQSVKATSTCVLSEYICPGTSAQLFVCDEFVGVWCGCWEVWRVGAANTALLGCHYFLGLVSWGSNDGSAVWVLE